jgi:hypothetical protein
MPDTEEQTSEEPAPEEPAPEQLNLEVPDGAYQFLLGITRKAEATAQEHDIAEELLSHLKTTIVQAKQRIRMLESRVEHLESETDDTD